MDDLTREVQDLKNSLQFSHDQLDELKQENGKMTVICKSLSDVREDPHEMDKNEWQLIATGRTIYTIANTTQMDSSSSKPYGKWNMANAKCHTPKIPKMVSALHRTFSYGKWS